MMRRARRKSPIDYILPFLIFLSIGIIVVLGVQLWGNWQNQGKADVYLYVVEGKSKLLLYGSSNWDTAYNGTQLLLGDSFKTLSGGRALLKFFNGSLMRLNSDTAITLTDLQKHSDQEKIVVNLDNGSLWVNGHKSQGVRNAAYEVRTSNMLVKAKGTIFEVENAGGLQLVRVFDGEIKVDILITSDGRERVADTRNVGVGQQIVLDSASIKSFEQNKEVSLLQAIDDAFKTTAWYLWNTKEDISPTDVANFVSSSGSSSEMTSTSPSPSTSLPPSTSSDPEDPTGGTPLTSETPSSSDSSSETTPSDTVFVLEKPVVSSPLLSARTITEGKVSITGTVKKGTAGVLVEQVIDGVIDSYALNKFKVGDTQWSYNAAEVFGNLRPGENTYSIYAIDSAGKKSAPVTVTIIYKKAVTTEDIVPPPSL